MRRQSILVQFCTVLTPEQIFEALERRREEMGMSQAQVGLRAFGKSDNSAFQGLRRGSSPSVERLAALAEALGLELYLGPPRAGEPQISYDAVADESDFVRIRRYDVQLSGGSGAFNGEDEIMAPIAFRKAWFRRHGLTPESCCIVGVRGDSMEPKLSDGDLVLLDIRQGDLVDRSIYGIVDLDGEARVKRIEVIENGYLLRSDNPYFKTELRMGDDAKRLKFIGRVVTALHELEE